VYTLLLNRYFQFADVRYYSLCAVRSLAMKHSAGGDRSQQLKAHMITRKERSSLTTFTLHGTPGFEKGIGGKAPALCKGVDLRLNGTVKVLDWTA